ncbi:MAG: SPASM domain-containing protein [Muribaculaceae bacterium]|nr:SPASM domain-containing protein [Muribaculaceae bacterium]
MELSIYTYLFKDSGKFYMYNSEVNFFSEISDELYKVLKNRSWQELPAEVLKELTDRKILVKSTEKYNHYNSQKLLFNARKYDSTRLSLVLVPTTACNFDCPYCFEPKANPKMMDAEVINQVRDFVKSFKEAKSLSLTWYGGEPLLAFEQIKKLYGMLTEEDMPKISSHSIVTNGYLFNQEVIDFFKATELKSIQITLDGTEQRHNTTRCLKGCGEPTFDVILRNIDNILRELNDAYLSIRVNIDRTNYKEYIELLRYFKNKYPDNKHLSVYPGLIRAETEDGKSLNCDCFSCEDIFELNQLVRAEGHDVRLFPKKESRGCMVHSLNSYIIGPEGELYKCWNDVSDPELTIGNISTVKLNGSSRLLDFMTETTPFNPECRNCHVFPVCGGGCAYYRLRNYREGASFAVCSPFRDYSRLKSALLEGVRPELT